MDTASQWAKWAPIPAGPVVLAGYVLGVNLWITRRSPCNSSPLPLGWK